VRVVLAQRVLGALYLVFVAVVGLAPLDDVVFVRSLARHGLARPAQSLLRIGLPAAAL
jgi:hypothetical protein